MKMRTFAKKHSFIFSVLVIVVGLSMMVIGSGIFRASESRSVLLMNLTGRLFPTILMLVIMKQIHLPAKEERNGHWGRNGVLLAIPVLALMIGIQLDYFWGKVTLDLSPSIFQVLVTLIADFCIGAFEESMMRGVVFQSMAGSRERMISGTIRAAVISSLMFGCLHFINLGQNPQLVYATLSQVGYATLLGIYLCGVFVKTGNLLVPVIIHALIDLTADLPKIFSSGYAAEQESEVALGTAIFQSVIFVPFALLGIWCIYSTLKTNKKTKLEKAPGMQAI